MTTWLGYFVLTQLLEGPVLVLALPDRSWFKALGASALTHPALWIALPALHALLPGAWAIVAAEAYAVVIEGAYLAVAGARRPWRAALFANGLSFVVGGLVVSHASADVLPAGHRQLEEASVVVIGTERFRDHDFWIGPTSEDEFERVTAGQRRSAYRRSWLVATPHDPDAPDRIPRRPGMIQSEVLPIERSVPEATPTTHLRLVVTVTGVSDSIAFTTRVLTASLRPREGELPPLQPGEVRYSVARSLSEAEWARVARGEPPIVPPAAPPRGDFFDRRTMESLGWLLALTPPPLIVLLLWAVRRRKKAR